jgi:hypothetical protein
VLTSFTGLLEEASHLHVNVNTAPVQTLVEQAQRWLLQSQKSTKEGNMVRSDASNLKDDLDECTALFSGTTQSTSPREYRDASQSGGRA